MSENQETKGKVVQFPTSEPQLSSEEQELHDKIMAIVEEQDGFIRKLVTTATDSLDAVANEKHEKEPDFQLLVHMPVEACFTSAAVFLNELSGYSTEETARAVAPFVDGMTDAIENAIDKYVQSNSIQNPSVLVYYALIQTAVGFLRDQRAVYAFANVTGENIEEAFNGGMDDED